MSEYIYMYQTAVVFTLGACFGSFLNVVILRFGTGRGLMGRSSCASCNRELSGRDLVPLFSYLFLRGRCRTCHARISPQYFFVEMLAGILFVLCAHVYTGIHFVFACMVVLLVIGIAVYDARHMRIPALWNYALIVVSVAFILSQQSIDSVVQSSVGVVTVAGLFLGAYLVSRGRVLGFGDVIFAVSLGILLGALDGLLAVWIACVLGSIYGGVMILWQKLYGRGSGSLHHHVIPFGPFLAIGLLTVFFNIVTAHTVSTGLFLLTEMTL